MKKVLITLIILLCMLGADAQNPRIVYSIWKAGAPNFDADDIFTRNAVSARWGIKYKNAGGCIISRFRAFNIDIHNAWVYMWIRARYGKDWQERLDKEGDAEYKTLNMLKDSLEKLDYIQLVKDDLIKNGGILYSYTRSHQGSIYYVTVSGKQHDKFTDFFYFLIDAQKKTITRTIKSEED
ncbi:MAG: hypothetical protein M0D57_06855 [Sphingobacteriales bacterium JAD_PAG50586_3]|nr:MAG: hypothetical protein M0D57_06855 [Sphingobacteriales bacterium JAD_PAG50586_3]